MEYFMISAKFVPLKYYTLSSQLQRLTLFSVGCSGRRILSPGQIAVMQKWSICYGKKHFWSQDIWFSWIALHLLLSEVKQLEMRHLSQDIMHELCLSLNSELSVCKVHSLTIKPFPSVYVSHASKKRRENISFQIKW